MAAPPRTRTTTWQVWVWLPLMKLRVDESQLRAQLRVVLARLVEQPVRRLPLRLELLAMAAEEEE